ncbi:hypothetical protein, partial [Photobacterium sanctipauli]
SFMSCSVTANAAYYQGVEQSHIAFEAEGYSSIIRHKGESDGFNIVSVNEFISDFGSDVLPENGEFLASNGSALLADMRYDLGQKRSTVEYKLVFNAPGTYRLYYRRSMFEKGGAESYGGEDSFFFVTGFGGETYKKHGTRTDQNSSVGSNPVTNPSEGKFFWFNTKHNFEVSEDDVGKKLSFTIQDREKGYAIDRFVFSHVHNLDVAEIGKDGDSNDLDELPNSDTEAEAITGSIFPMDYVPSSESDDEVLAREEGLLEVYSGYLDYVEQQNAVGNASLVIDELISENNSQDDAKSALRTLITLITEDAYYPEWKAEVVQRFHEEGERKRLEAIDVIEASNGKINDLKQVTPIRRYMDYAWGLYVLDTFHSDSPEAISFRTQFEEFVSNYIEGTAPYYDNAYYTTGYNKEVFAMDVASTISLLYQESSLFPKVKTAFDAFWENVTQISYENDNSPHYGAGTGFHIILNIALRHGRESEVIDSEHLERNMDRMARTVMNSGQSAKWGKSMEKNSNGQMRISAGRALHWDLKLGYQLWNNPFYLYVARKYEAFYLHQQGPFAADSYKADIWPMGIDAAEITLAKPSAEDTVARVTKRITSCCAYDGLLLGRGDTNYVEVQDKLMVSTGHHPRAPFLMMNLSYTQHKAGQDLRLGIDVHNYNGAHTISRIKRWSEANKNNGIYINPSEYTYPNAPYPAKEISAPGYPVEFEEVMQYNQQSGYVIDSYGVQSLSAEAAYGFADYHRYQYSGVGAKRQVVLLHNGITVVSDTISSATTYPGGHNGGALYQVLPQQKSLVGENWVLLRGQSKMLPHSLPAGEKETLDTLVIFASVPDNT